MANNAIKLFCFYRSPLSLSTRLFTSAPDVKKSDIRPKNVPANDSKKRLMRIGITYCKVFVASHLTLVGVSAISSFAIVKAGVDIHPVIEALHMEEAKTVGLSETNLIFAIHHATFYWRFPLTVFLTVVFARPYRKWEKKRAEANLAKRDDTQKETPSLKTAEANLEKKDDIPNMTTASLCASLQVELAAKEQTLGRDNPETLFVMARLADALQEDGQLFAAHDVFQKLVAEECKTFGPAHSVTVRTVKKFVTLLLQLEKLEQARALLKSTVDAQTSLQSEDDNGDLKYELSSLLFRLGDCKEARELATALFQAHIRKLGPEHKLTQRAESLLYAINTVINASARSPFPKTDQN